MRFIQDVGQPFAGKPVTIISSGQSTADYLAETATDDVVLINHAINLAPQLSDKNLYHVTMHHEAFGRHPHLSLPNVTQVTGQWAEPDVLPDLQESTILFATRQFGDIADPAMAPMLHEPALCHVANSSHCAIHLTWLWGCRDLRIIGANEYRGVAGRGYDPRFNLSEEQNQQCTPGWYYIDSFRRFVGLFDWDRVCWYGY